MSARPRTEFASVGTLWAVAVMETAVALVLLWRPTESAAGIPPWAGPLLAVGLLPLATWLGQRFPWLLERNRRRLLVGAGLAIVLRLLVTPLPDFAASPLAGIPGWLLGALPAAAFGLLLWWRGCYLATAEVTASEVRGEFALLAGALLAAMTVFRAAVAPDAGVAIVCAVLFVAAGLAAVGLSRQDEAGSPGARGMVAGSILLPLIGAGVLVAVLRPAVVQAILGGLNALAQVILTVLLFLLQPLFWLLSQWRPELQPLPRRGPEAPAGDPGDLANRQPLPEWVVWLLLAVAGLVAALAIAFLIWAVLAVLAPGWFRFRGRGRAPVAIESDGGPTEDLLEAAHQLQRWLQQRLRRRLSRPSDALVDARSAYRRLLRWARRTSTLEPAKADTPRRFQVRLDERVPAATTPVRAITAAYERERYGGRTTTRDEVAALEAALRDLERVEQPEGGSSP